MNDKMDKIRIAGYINIRYAGYGNGGSFKSKCDYMKELLQKRDDCEMALIYCDEGCTKEDKRIAFAKMKRDAEARKFDYHVVKKFEHLYKDGEKRIKIIKELKEWGIGVFSISDNVCTTTEKGETFMRLYEEAALAEKQWKDAVAKLKKTFSK